MTDLRMRSALAMEARALVAMPNRATGAGRNWSINADAGTVRDLRDDSLIASLHPVVLDPMPGFWFFPHHGGST